jgi:hypothetical protein
MEQRERVIGMLKAVNDKPLRKSMSSRALALGGISATQAGLLSTSMSSLVKLRLLPISGLNLNP